MKAFVLIKLLFNGNESTPKRSLFSIGLIACAFYFLYFFRLGGCPLLDPDEPVYGEVGKEMANGAGWLTPHLNGNLWFDKPPLFYWLSGASVSLFGPTEMACRLASALAGVGLVLLVYLLAKRDFGKRVALLSAIVMATCLQQIILARAAVTDMVFVLCLTAALYCYRRLLESTKVSVWTFLCGCATGLAMLTKGPVAPLLLLVTFIIHLAWLGELKRLLSSSLFPAFGMALVVGLPWYGAMYLLHGEKFVQGFLVANNITRFLKAEHTTQTGHWYSIFINIPILFLFFFPWSLFLWPALTHAWKSYGGKRRTLSPEIVGIRLAIVWFGVVFVFFSLSKTILVTYIFPVYPAAAMMVGIFWSNAEKSVLLQRSVKRGLYAVGGVTILISIGLVITASKKQLESPLSFLMVGAILLAAAVVALVLLRQKPALDAPPDHPIVGQKGLQLFPSVWSLGIGMTALTVWLAIAILPSLSKNESSRDLIGQLPSGALNFATYRVAKPSALFYLSFHPSSKYLGLLDDAQIKQATHDKAPFFVLCNRNHLGFLSIPGLDEWASSGKLVVLANASARSLPRVKDEAIGALK